MLLRFPIWIRIFIVFGGITNLAQVQAGNISNKLQSSLSGFEKNHNNQKINVPMISVVAPDWEGYSSESGEGLYWDIIRAIYEPVGVRVKLNTAPWNRALKMVTRYRTYMAIPGEYLDSTEPLIFPQYPLEREKLVSVSLKSRKLQLNTIKQFQNLTVSWRKGYDLLEPDNYNLKLKEFRECAVALRNIISSKVDVVIEERDEVQQSLEQAGLLNNVFEIKPYPESQYVYLGFNEGIHSETLINTYNQRTETMVKSGALRAIFKKWQVDYPEIYTQMEIHQTTNTN